MVCGMTSEGVVRLGDLAAGPVRRKWVPDEAVRAALAARLGVRALPALEAELEVRSWMDGCEVSGRFRARVTQVCGVTLEPFDQPANGDIELRLVPEGSPSLPEDAAAGEVEISLESPDPPEPLEGDAVDLYALVEEHLALEIDPFPRRPDAVFDWTPEAREDSPFAALKALKPPNT
jgi:uncharacterized metal-binding protein YceD (DUF177 family)